MKSKFTLIAIGELLKMAPLALLTLLMSFPSINRNEDIFLTILGLFCITVLGGYIITIIGGFTLLKPMSERSVSLAGPVTIAITFCFFALAFLGQIGFFEIQYDNEMSWEMVIALILFFYSYYFIMMIGCGKLGQYFSGIGKAKAGYLVIAISLIVGMIINRIILGQAEYGYYDYYYYFDNDKFIPANLLMTVGVIVGTILVITGWFQAAREAREIEEADDVVTEEVSVEYTQVKTTPVSTAQPSDMPQGVAEDTIIGVKPLPVVPTMPEVDPYTQQLIDYAKTLTADQLEYVLANPDQYEADFMRICADELAKR